MYVLRVLMQLVAANQLSAALLLARSQLTPLADKHPDLLPSLKASMALLLPGPAGNNDSSSSSSHFSAVLAQRVWDMLLPQLQHRLGVEPPQLVSLLQVRKCEKG